MASALLTLTLAHQYVCSWLYPAPQKSEKPIKIGVLSTAPINPASIIHPARTHPEVSLYAIASRDVKQAQSYAKKYGFQTSYGSYKDLLDDPNVELVYIALPNGLHFEWAYKAIEANKHVLVEKPLTSNAIEATKLVEKARDKGKLLMEAMHWEFHPAAHKFRQILDQHVTNSGRGSDDRFIRYGHDGRFGRIIMTDAKMTATPAVPKNDARWRFDLGGGSLMDMAYVVSFTRFALRAGLPEEVTYTKVVPSPQDKEVDERMEARLKINCPDDEDMGAGRSKGEKSAAYVYSTIFTDLAKPWKLWIIPRFWELPSICVETERAEIYFYNAFLPHLYHYIAVRDRKTGKTTYEHLYKGGPVWGDRGEVHWSTYRYQLEAVVDKLRGREPAWWISGEESIAEMQTIDMVYKKSGLALRPTHDSF